MKKLRQAQVGTDSVANKVNAAEDGAVVNFADIIPTVLTSNDLATSIHGVNFQITGSITKTDNWSGDLNISFSDPYDFNPNADDWKVRFFGRLSHYGWLPKFNVTGSWKVKFEE
jgi:hypothetical protein